jgi:hypothetical protein
LGARVFGNAIFDFGFSIFDWGCRSMTNRKSKIENRKSSSGSARGDHEPDPDEQGRKERSDSGDTQ